MLKKVVCSSFLKALFCLIILASYFCVFFVLQYDVLTQHDLVFAYGRKFLQPEHGRYIANFVTNFLTETLPEYINIHPNDLQPTLMAFIKGICVIIQCLLIANSLFIFSKKKNNVLNPAFLAAYITVFLLLFNKFYFFPLEDKYFESSFFFIFENMVFFEYPMSIMLYVILFSFLIYYLVNKQAFATIPRKWYIAILITAFFTGISVDPVNVPVFVMLTIIGIQLLIKHKIEPEKFVLKNFLGVYLAFFIGYLIYFTRPIHHELNYHNLTFLQYVHEYFVPYCIEFYNYFIKVELYIPAISLLLLISLLLFKQIGKNYKNRNQFIFIIAVCVFTYILFEFSIFILGFHFGKSYFYSMDKWIIIYRVIELFNLIVIFGYLIDANQHINEKTSNIIKIALCIIVLLIFRNKLIIDYEHNLITAANLSKEIRISAYKLEKLAIEEKTKDYIVPKKYKDPYYNHIFFLEEDFCSFAIYVNNVHPEITKSIYITYSDNIDDDSILTEDELKELKFSNLLQNKMYRHKKTILRCY